MTFFSMTFLFKTQIPQFKRNRSEENKVFPWQKFSNVARGKRGNAIHRCTLELGNCCCHFYPRRKGVFELLKGKNFLNSCSWHSRKTKSWHHHKFSSSSAQNKIEAAKVCREWASIKRYVRMRASLCLISPSHFSVSALRRGWECEK